MKKYILTLLIIACTNFAFAQTPCFIRYTYDNAGNRIKREFVCESDNTPNDPEENTHVPGPGGNARRVPAADGNAVIDLNGYSLVYPNPNYGAFWVEFKNEANDAVPHSRKIYVLNAAGQLLLETEVTTAKTFVQLEGVAAGNYFVIVYDGKANNPHKITVVR